jgi:hypothetical protein
MLRLDDDNFVSLKFTCNGEIKPIYGLTCVTWVDESSALHSELTSVQRSIQAELVRAGTDHYFFFLDPASFHMTICDIIAQPTPLPTMQVETVHAQIHDTFSERKVSNEIKAQVRGLGLVTTITALVHFQQESELQKVLYLERQIKQATRVDVRDFLGHITLAYGVKNPKNEIGQIRDILQRYQGQDFGGLGFSEFDLTYFTDMNTFHPLSTINFANGEVQTHATKSGSTSITEADL